MARDASLRPPCRSRPTPCCSPTGVARRHRRGAGHRRRDRDRVRPVRRRRRDLRPRRRRPRRAPARRSWPPAAARTPRCSTCATATPCARGSSRFRPIDVLVNNAGGGFHADVPRRERQGPGLARSARTSPASRTSSARACRRCRPTGGVDHQHHVDRGAPRRARLRGLQRDEGRGREPDEDARARARRPAHPRQLHRPRRDPDAGHRRRHAGQDAAAVRGPRRRRRGRGRLPRVRLVALRHRHHDARRRRQPRRGRLGRAPTAAGSTAGDAVDGA